MTHASSTMVDLKKTDPTYLQGDRKTVQRPKLPAEVIGTGAHGLPKTH